MQLYVCTQNGFAQFEFSASKQQLFNILNDRNITVHLIHKSQNGANTELGQATIPLSKVLQAKLKQTPNAMVRVYEDTIDVKDVRTNQLKANMRVILFLEDNGVSKNQSKPMGNLQQARDLRSGVNAANQIGNTANVTQDQALDYQAVWQLEMWKRSEEAKFKAYLKQREIEKIEEITKNWKSKESERE